jgi:hypothetical protein
MGSGIFSARSFASYSHSKGKSYDSSTGRITSGQEFTAIKIDPTLDPKNVVRECANSNEHPNTIPVILALDVTGSMGPACQETAEALGVIMTDLYTKFKDIEFCIMGIGDLSYDRAPIQMSQFESDVRIAESIDKIYREGGGGGNGFESYTAAWYMGLCHTKLDAYDKQGRKGIIITMGDEPLNPYLPGDPLSQVTGDSIESNIETSDLYQEVIKKFDVFHIAITDHSSYSYYANRIENSFGQLLGPRYKASTIQKLAENICECITESINGRSTDAPQVKVDESGISW